MTTPEQVGGEPAVPHITMVDLSRQVMLQVPDSVTRWLIMGELRNARGYETVYAARAAA
ncbi:MAG: hypothetical protein ACRDSZ_21960 [Pseudonocardiaceae bacterium]